MCTSTVAYYYQKITETKDQNSLKFTANPRTYVTKRQVLKVGLEIELFLS